MCVTENLHTNALVLIILYGLLGTPGLGRWEMSKQG